MPRCKADGRGLRLGRLVVVAGEDVDNRAAVGDHVALEAPLAAQLILEQELVGAGGLAVNAVVGAHHRVGLALCHRGAEGGQIGVQFVVLAHHHVCRVARGLRTAVHGKMLGGGDDAIVMRIVALHAGHKGHAHARRQEGIFAVGFLAAAPAGIAEDVDVGRPEVEARQRYVLSPSAHCLHVHDAPLGADDLGHLVNGRRVEGGGQADGLGELGGAVVQHAVQRLAPPVVGRHVEAGNGPRLVHQLRGLLFQRHPPHQVRRALLGGQAGVKIRWLGVLRPGHTGCRAQRQHRRNPSQFSRIHRNPLLEIGIQ